MRIHKSALACLFFAAVLAMCPPPAAASPALTGVTSPALTGATTGMITITTSQHPISNTRSDTYTWSCPGDYPYSVNWKDNSDNGNPATTLGVRATGEIGTGRGDRNVTINFYNSDVVGPAAKSQNHTFGIIYTCSKHWKPTTTQCGGYGQRVCWGAIKLGDHDWRRIDWEFHINGAGACERGLIVSGGTSSATCVDPNTDFQRYQLSDDSWQNWALDNQRYGISADEPMNWVTLIGSHQSANTRVDHFPFPNQYYSISDQLTWGARYLDLRPRWISTSDYDGYLRLSHTADGGSASGGSTLDRFYTYAIQEIGRWLDQNPDQVIQLDIGTPYGDVAAPSPDYLNDPLAAYLGNKILTPSEWCNYLRANYPTIARPYPLGTQPDTCSGARYVPYRWPTIGEMRDLDKQVFIFGGESMGETWAFTALSNSSVSGNNLDPQAGYGAGRTFPRSFDSTNCLRDGVQYLFNSDAGANERDYFNRVQPNVGEARVMGQELTDSWPGYLFADDQSRQAAIDAGVPGVYRGEGAYPGTLLEGLVNCNVPHISFDYFGAPNYFESNTVVVNGQTDRRNAMIWSWATGDWGNGGGRAQNNCAVLGASDNRWHSRGCDEIHRFACAKPRSGDPTTWGDVLQEDWAITQGTGAWDEGPSMCRQEYPGFVFSNPRNARANQKLIGERNGQQASSEDIWLAYSDKGSGWSTSLPPTITALGTMGSGAGAYDFDTWTNNNVTVAVDASVDDNSSIASIDWQTQTYDAANNQIGSSSGTFPTQGPSNHLVQSEGYTRLTLTATSSEGIAVTREFDIRIDKTAPTITGASDRAPNTYGWYNRPVTVSFTCRDSDGPFPSSIATCPPPVVFEADGANQQASGSTTDRAGNRSGVVVVGPINLDRTSPTITYSGNAGTYTIDQTVAITCASADNLSGVLSDTCQDVNGPAWSFTLGDHPYAASATDRAENRGTGSTTFTIRSTFDSQCIVTQRFAADAGIANGMCEVLAVARDAATRGDTAVKNRAIATYNQLVEAAVTSRKITAEQGRILTYFANSL